MEGRPSTYDRLANSRFRLYPGVKATFLPTTTTIETHAKQALGHEQRQHALPTASSILFSQIITKADDTFRPVEPVPQRLVRASDAFEKRRASNPSKLPSGLRLIGHFSLLSSAEDIASLSIHGHRDHQPPIAIPTCCPPASPSVHPTSASTFAHDSVAPQVSNTSDDEPASPPMACSGLCPPIDCDEEMEFTEVHISRSTTGLSRNDTVQIIESVHAVVVSPRNAEVVKCKSLNFTYGEMMPDLVERIIRLARLTSGSLFLDLGSGVGNVVLYIALRTGCRSFGIEYLQTRAVIAQEQLERVRVMARGKEGSMGPVKLVHGDIMTHAEVPKLIGEADLVLVNNYSFDKTLSIGIGNLFRRLKQGAYVISLSPVGVSARGGRASARDEDALGTMMDASLLGYEAESVSWTGSAGQFYVHVMKGNGQGHSM